MKIHYLIIGILLVSGVTLGMMNYLSFTSASDTYDSTVDLDSLNQTEARLIKQQGDVQNLSITISNFTLDSAIDYLTIPYKLYQVSWGTGKLVFNSFYTVGAMMDDAEATLDESDIITIPDWIFPTFIATIIILVVAILIFAFFKWNWSD